MLEVAEIEERIRGTIEVIAKLAKEGLVHGNVSLHWSDEGHMTFTLETIEHSADPAS